MNGALTLLVCPACNARYEAGGFCAIDGTPLQKQTVEHADLVGQVLADRYRIVRLLGEGGMGQVYEASHVNIHRRYALKMLRPQIVSDPDAVARFRQEAWSASSIGHENIVEIDDFATLPSGAVYLAMEYLDGESLADRLKRTPGMSLIDIVVTFRQVCAGLGAAHDKGIIHRDMKPENIFLHRRGQRTIVKILDFGIAKVTSGEAGKNLTRTGAIFGTPFYMSPEQALGSPVDVRSDIYSVGVMLYEVFAGQVPFVADSFMGILSKHIATAPQPLSQLKPGIAPEIEALVMRAIAKDPAQRQPDMAELDRELTALVPFEELVAAMQLPSGPVVLPSGVTPMPGGIARVSAPVAVSPAGISAGMPVATPSANLPTQSAAMTGQAPVKKSSAGVVVGGLLALAVVGGGGLWYWRTNLGGAVVPVAPVTVPVVGDNKPATPTPVEPPILDEVTLDSVPTGAIIIGLPLGADGAQPDTPENITITHGQTLAVEVHKDGFVDAKVLLDPARSKKVMVRLEPVAPAAVHAAHHQHELPPFAHPPPPEVHEQPPPIAKPAVGKPVAKTSAPIYPLPAAKPPATKPPAGKSEVLDPY